MTQVNIPSATAVRMLTENGGNLFRIALDNLGSALQWNRIAQANKLLDPFLPANTQIVLVTPPINFAASDSGVLQPNGILAVVGVPVDIFPPMITVPTVSVPVDVQVPVIS